MIQQNEKIKVYNSLIVKISKLNVSAINCWGLFFALKSITVCGTIKNIPSFIDNLSQITGFSDRTIRTRLQQLEQMDLITRKKDVIFLTSFKKCADHLKVKRLREPKYIDLTKLLKHGYGLQRKGSFVTYCKFTTIQRNIENQNNYVKTKRIQEIVYYEYVKSLNNAQPRNDKGTNKQFKSRSVATLKEKLSNEGKQTKQYSKIDYWYKHLTKEQRKSLSIAQLEI